MSSGKAASKVAAGRSIAAYAVAAHEVGHAIQDARHDGHCRKCEFPLASHRLPQGNAPSFSLTGPPAQNGGRGARR